MYQLLELTGDGAQEVRCRSVTTVSFLILSFPSGLWIIFISYTFGVVYNNSHSSNYISIITG
jgi:hypothetical protein